MSIGLVAFGLVHGGIGGGVDHGVGGVCFNRTGAAGRVGQIGGGTVEGDDLDTAAIQRPQFRGDLPAVPKDKNLHAVPSRLPTPLRFCSARHQSSFSRYQSTVCASPSSTVTEGCQPSSDLMREGSMA